MTTLNTSELKTAIRLVMSGTGTEQALEGADSILFSGSALHSHNGDVSVSVPLKDADDKDTDLHGCVKAKTFAAWVNKVKTDSIEIKTLEDGSWEITAGKSQINPTPFVDPLSEHLNALNLTALEWSDLPEDFHSSMTLVRLENAKTTQPYVRFAGNVALSSDTMRSNSVDFDRDLGNFAIHTDDLRSVLQSTDLRQIALSPSKVHFLTASGTVWTVRRISGEDYRVPNHLKVIEMVEAAIAAEDPRNLASDLPVGLADAVDKLGVYAATDMEAKASIIYMTLTADGMSLGAQRTEGKARESLEWPEKLAGEIEVSLAVSGPFLKEAAARGLKFHYVNMDVQTAQGTQTASRIVFRGGKFTQVVKGIAV